MKTQNKMMRRVTNYISKIKNTITMLTVLSATSFLSTDVMAQQAIYESRAVNSLSNSKSPVIEKPAGLQSNELMLVSIWWRGNAGATVPSGYTLIENEQIGNGAGRLSMISFYKIANSSDAAASNFTYSNLFSSNSDFSISMTRISNVNTVNPIQVSTYNMGNSTDVIASGVTTTEDYTLVLTYFSIESNRTFDPEVSLTEYYNFGTATGNSGRAGMMAVFEQDVAGSTGNKTSLFSGNGTLNFVTHTIAINYGLTLLPVTLTDFSAETISNSVLLKWTTASEMNNSHFEIERSNDGVQWASIGQVIGNGNSDELNNYEFSDMNPLSGINYYRLKQVDFNGDFNYSELREVMINSVRPEQVNLYPNPAVNVVNIDVPSTVESVTTEIRTMDGRVIKSETFSNSSTASISVQDLIPGVYYMHIQMGSQVIVKTILKN